MRRDAAGTFVVQASAELHFAPARVIEVLAPCVSGERLAKIEAIARARTDALSLVLESVDDPHNASATLRSAEAFGVGRVDIIPGRHGFRAARAITKNAHRWLDLRFHESARACAEALKEDGYAIYVASMEGAIGPRALQREERVAVVFGNEHRGASSEIRAEATGTYAIPMRGFVESLNVSVAVAVTAFSLTQDRPPDPEARIQERVATMLVQSVPASELILARAASDTSPAL